MDDSKIPVIRWRWRSYCLVFLALLAFAIVLSFLLPIMGETKPIPALPTAFHLEYSTVPGYFLTDDPNTDPTRVVLDETNFGLIDRPYDTDTSLPTDSEPTQWARFAHKLATMNEQAPEATSYKVLFLGRHGEGWHNVGERFFGSKAWDCYYSMLNGTNNMTFFDPRLTDRGMSQARQIAEYWRRMIKEQNIPTPQRFILSPLDRAVHTANLTFGELDLSPDRPYLPVVKENLRETIGIHTCDHRSTKSQIAQRWAEIPLTIEDHFSENDELWRPDKRESHSAQFVRLRNFLDDIFTDAAIARSKHVEYVSLTSHGGSLGLILSVLGHGKVAIETGGVLPVFVMVKQVKGRRENDVEVKPWEPRPNCTEEELEQIKKEGERKTSDRLGG